MFPGTADAVAHFENPCPMVLSLSSYSGEKQKKNVENAQPLLCSESEVPLAIALHNQ